MKEQRILLVRLIVGRETARKHPLNQDQYTNIITVETTGVGNGMMIEMIPAIERFGSCYTIVRLPDGKEIPGNIFFKAKDYTRIPDTPATRQGLLTLIKKRNQQDEALLKIMQKDKKSIQRYVESFL